MGHRWVEWCCFSRPDRGVRAPPTCTWDVLDHHRQLEVERPQSPSLLKRLSGPASSGLWRCPLHPLNCCPRFPRLGLPGACEGHGAPHVSSTPGYSPCASAQRRKRVTFLVFLKFPFRFPEAGPVPGAAPLRSTCFWHARCGEGGGCYAKHLVNV